MLPTSGLIGDILSGKLSMDEARGAEGYRGALFCLEGFTRPLSSSGHIALGTLT